MTTVQATAPSRKQNRGIGHFLFAEEVPYGVAVVRILLPLVLLGAVIPRWYHARELFSIDGAPAPLWNLYGQAALFPIVSGTLAVALFSVLVLLLVTTSLGFCTRISLVGATVLYAYFNTLDAVSTMTKYSVIATHVLLLLSLSHCGSIWSVDAWLRRRRHALNTASGESVSDGSALARPTAAAWPRRLIQFLIGCIYLGGAVTKIHTPGYFTGEQMQAWMMTDYNYAHPFGTWLSMYPSFIVASCYSVIVWEIAFIFVAWKGWGRAAMLGAGVVFHLMTTFMLGLYIFPAVYMAIYFAFFEEKDAKFIANVGRIVGAKLGFSRRRAGSTTSPAVVSTSSGALGLPAPVCLVVAIAAVAFVGVQFELWMDPYGTRRPEGQFALKKLDSDYVEQVLLARAEPLRDVDKFGPLQIGTTLIGDALAFRRTRFQHGERLIAQSNLNPAHEDLWLECSLVTSSERIIDTVGLIVPRDVLRANYYFNLIEALEPGEYSVVLKKAGTEVLRRRFTLSPRSNVAAPVAN